MKLPSFKINFILLFLILSTFVSYSQEQEIAAEKGILVTKKDSSSTLFLKENKRIKVKLLDGKVYVGKFQIINDSTFSIRDNIISLDSIAKIKRRSLVSSIFSPVVIVYGIGLVSLGVVGIAYGGYVIILGALILPGLPMVLVPLISENHRPQKWNYSIGTNPKNKKLVPN